MKNIVKVLFVAAIMVIGASTQTTAQIAYIDADSIIVHMPEYDAAVVEIQTVTEQKQKLLQLKQQQIVAFQQELELTRDDMTKVVWDEKVALFQKMQQDFQAAQAQAEQELAFRENRAMQAIYAKLNVALELVAAEKGLTYILDKKMTVYAKADEEITEAVKTVLGI